MAKKRRILKAWHLIPLSLIALIMVAAFVWVTRGDFSPKEVDFHIEGPDQMENGKATNFKVIIGNGSSKALENANVSLELPSTIAIQEGKEAIDNGFEKILPGETREIQIVLVASSTRTQERISARLDYSPESVSARFVSMAKKDIVIGTLDASIIFDLPNTIFADQQINGAIHIIPNSDVEASPIYLRLEMPENFELNDTSHQFSFDTVWELGKLSKGNAIKREFQGALSSADNRSPTFRIAVGILDGANFLELKSVEHTVNISESPLFLEQSLVGSTRDSVNPGEKVTVKMEYLNKTSSVVEDAVVSVQLPQDLIDTDSIQADNARIDKENAVIEWDSSTLSRLRSIAENEGGEFVYSFDVLEDIEPEDNNDANKVMDLKAVLRSNKEDLSLNGAVLQAEDTLSLKITTQLSLQQSIYRSGGSIQNTGPHPPEANELSTYTVRWELSNSTNTVRSGRIEALLPEYAIWRNETNTNNESVRFVSTTKTVVWDAETVSVGTGYFAPQRVVEFQIGVLPDEQDIQNGVNILEQTKVTGIDNFTSVFLEQDLSSVGPSE